MPVNALTFTEMHSIQAQVLQLVSYLTAVPHRMDLLVEKMTRWSSEVEDPTGTTGKLQVRRAQRFSISMAEV